MQCTVEAIVCWLESMQERGTCEIHFEDYPRWSHTFWRLELPDERRVVEGVNLDQCTVQLPCYHNAFVTHAGEFLNRCPACVGGCLARPLWGTCKSFQTPQANMPLALFSRLQCIWPYWKKAWFISPTNIFIPTSSTIPSTSSVFFYILCVHFNPWRTIVTHMWQKVGFLLLR